MALLASNPLIQVTPGLMIWTIVCFFVTFYVLKRFAFGRIQQVIDERRKRIRSALDEADQARAEAHRLVEEHRATMAQARSQAEEILADARKVAEAQKQRQRGELEEDRLRGRRPDRDRDAEGDRQGPRRAGSQAPDRRGDRRARLLRPAARKSQLAVAVVARTYARALFEAARERGRIDEVREELASFLEAVEEVPELRAVILNPELDPPQKAAALEALLAEAD